MMKRLITFLHIFFLSYYCFCQDSIDSNKTINSYTSPYWPEKHSNNNYTSIDTSFYYLNNKKIMVVKKFLNGNKIKTNGYYPDGKLFQEVIYINDSLWIWNSYHKNGNLDAISYLIGEERKLSILFNDTGHIIGFSEDCNKISLSFYENGDLLEKNISNNTDLGDFQRINYYKSGLIKSNAVINAGRQQYNCFYENGQLYVQGDIIHLEGFRVGLWQEWYKDGQLSREFFFHDSIPNQREGKWKWWDEEGNLIKEEKYKNGELIDTKEYLLEIEKKTD